jgi:hypothetical protein
VEQEGFGCVFFGCCFCSDWRLSAVCAWHLRMRMPWSVYEHVVCGVFIFKTPGYSAIILLSPDPVELLAAIVPLFAA